MLLPYNVDRPTKLFPWVTYSLIGLNVFVFLWTIFVANFNLPEDQSAAKIAIARLLDGDSKAERMRGAVGLTTDDGETISQEQVDELLQYRALELASQHTDTLQGYKEFWQIQHANDTYVLEPHYSVLDYFAYRVAEPSPFWKLVGMFGGMFLHGGVEHLLGNMLFLWVFGRALEEFLGQKFYLGAYFMCGVAATLLFHVMTQIFAPQNAAIPSMGASGAIAGVLGLFAVRFYRTRVRVFYLLPWASVVFFILLILAALLLYGFLQDVTAAVYLGGALALVGMFFWGRTWAWGAIRPPSVWAIGVWLVLFNLLPALRELVGGEKDSPVAYWAHVGGFLCGALYAFLIGGIEGGKNEYLLEDAQTALQTSHSSEAMAHAQKLLERQEENAGALEVMARAFERQKNWEAATQNYLKAIQISLKTGDRDNAARLYLAALVHNRQFPLSPAQMLALGAHMARAEAWKDASALLTRLYTEFPEAPETEVALLRVAQISLRGLGNSSDAAWLFGEFLRCFPLSDMAPQAKAGLEMAQKAALAK